MGDRGATLSAYRYGSRLLPGILVSLVARQGGRGLGGIEVSAGDIHLLIGRAKGSAPDPAAFAAVSERRAYGDLVVERTMVDAIRVTSVPTMRKDLPAIVLFRVNRGGLNASHDQRTFALKAGECVLMISSGQYDFLVEKGETIQARIPLRLFAPHAIADLLAALDIPASPSLVTSSIWAAVGALVDEQEDDAPDPARDQALESLVVELMIQVSRQILQAQRGVDARSPLLTAALLYLEDHLSQADLDIDTIAAALGTSSRTLSREFRSIGTSPIAALRDARLSAAAHRLSAKAPMPSLDQLAQECGYSDRTALTRAFRRRYGRSPLDHRRRVMPFAERPTPAS